jgi:selT/selW/selH-like putative selenoprotein
MAVLLPSLPVRKMPMKFEILYCGPCGYLGRAEQLAAELHQRFGVAASIEEGRFGQFDVLLDGEVVASKGKFLRRILVHGAPPQHELLQAIERAVAVREGDACEVPSTPPS